MIVLIFLVPILCMVGYFYISLYWLNLDLYFLKFDISKHPILIAMIEDVLQKIGDKEGVKVFYKSYEDLNKNYPEEKDKAVGLYVYTLDAEHQKKTDDFRREIEAVEKRWRKPYNEVCKFVGCDSFIEEDSFILPKILLCKEQILKYGLLSYYSTYFHEFGHHFAIKANGDRSEEGADIMGYKLVTENLPFYFQLFSYINFRHRIKSGELTIKEKLIAYYGYWRYTRIKNSK